MRAHPVSQEPLYGGQKMTSNPPLRCTAASFPEASRTIVNLQNAWSAIRRTSQKKSVPSCSTPQTAGDLLLSVARSDADSLVTALNSAGVPAVEIGECCRKGSR